MNKVIESMKKVCMGITVLALTLSLFVAIPNMSVSAAEKNVYSFIKDFPTKQGENGWRMYCGASSSFYDSAKKAWTNKDSHQKPSSFKKDVITTCDKGGVSYIDFIAPKSGSISVVFKAKITAPANDGGDGTYGGGLFGIHLSDAKRTNPNEADKQSSEPIFPAGLEAWFISGRYELQDGETLEVEEFVDITKGQIVQFCFCSKGDPWKMDLKAFEIRYDDETGTDTSSVTQNTSSNTDSKVPNNSTESEATDTSSNTESKPTSSVDSGSSDAASEQSPSGNKTESSDSETADDITTGNNATNDEGDTTVNNEKNYTGLIVGIAIGAVVLIGAIVAVFVICHKKGII